MPYCFGNSSVISKTESVCSTVQSPFIFFYHLLLEAGYDVTDLEELIFNPEWLEECLADVLGVSEPEIVLEL